MNLEKVLKRIESNDSASGIGSAAATAGVLAASLAIKVAHKSKLYKLKKDIRNIQSKLIILIDKDRQAFKDYVKSLRSKDKKRIEYNLKHATETPLMIAEKSCKLLELTEEVFDKGNISLALEAYGAASLGNASVLSATSISEMNCLYLKDEKYVKYVEAKVAYLNSLAEDKMNYIHNQVNKIK